MPAGSRASDPGGASDTGQAAQQPGTQSPTEKEIAVAWQSTPFAVRHSLFAEHALLSIRVLDPACGSGHFLLAAARRLGRELARVRAGEDEPSPEALREAVRDVIAHCIYGVDKNPLAVELCKVALWIESQVPGRPLTFLDHRIGCGDSLVGVFDLEVLRQGIPDEAYDRDRYISRTRI
ncbi:DNA methyltransferase, partial [Synechococcus sp. F70.1]|uniref:DNA methyltransferase n=1 Tax=Synechococcus sp. F70.1 TaxID=2964532 RepID=UPI0039C732A6